MRTVIARREDLGCIAKQGERLAVQVMFPIAELLPDAEQKEYTLLIRTDEDPEPYTPAFVQLSATGKYLCWIPMLEDTMTPGDRTAQIRATAGDRKAFSAPYRFSIAKSLEYDRDNG